MIDLQSLQTYHISVLTNKLPSIFRSNAVDCGDQKTEKSYDSCYRQILEQVQLLLQGPAHVSELCQQKFMLWSVDPEGEVLNRSCDVSLKDQKLRTNLWKKIYRETCE